jgi:two-component system nitrate/nitrite response regulator NarL
MLRVLIVTDIRLFRDGLVEILRFRADIDVAGAASSASEALARIVELQPTTVLLDVGMGESLACVRAICQLSPDTKVLALGVAEEADDVLGCAEAGFAGFVSRNASVEDLVAALEGADRGEVACTPAMAGLLLRRVASLARSQGVPGAMPALTPRELEVLRLLDRRFTNKEIAKQLGIEVATVKNHVHNLLEKLHVHRRRDAAAKVEERMAR